MARRSRTRPVLKWLGVAACAFLLLAFVATRWWAFACVVNGWGLGFERGVIAFGYDSTAPSGFLHTEIDSPVLVWRPVWISRSVPYGFVSLWVPLLVASILTTLLWLHDRPIPPGHCQKCGYDLTGNVSGVCPECGQPIDAREA